MNKKIRPIIITLIFIGVYYYLFLPPFNLSSPFFWLSLLFIVAFYLMVSGIGSLTELGSVDKKGNFIRNNSYVPNKQFVIILKISGLIALILILINIIYSPLLNTKGYATRIIVQEDANFIEDVKPVDFDKLALLDKDSSRKLGDRVMGQLPELVSQFDVSSLYTQISHSGNIERVTPLEYADIFKYFSNRKDGITGYIKVDSVTGESTLQRTEQGLKYMRSAYFNDNLERKLRFNYPTEIFGKITFEVDDENNPYWIVPVLKYKGIGLMESVSHIIIFNPIDGTSNKYNVKDTPEWVDHAYDAKLIVDQINDWGQYKNGFFNSIFGQKGVVTTTNGYNYLVIDGDVYMTTGITSAVRDESNVGFVLSNLRTKETKFYEVPGAEEYSAMASAQGQVQQMNYTATFPILINLNNRPTYLISLKDKAGLVKMYAFVDLEDYQKVVVTESSKGIVHASKMFLGNSIDETKEQKENTIQINSINPIVHDGTTTFYITDTENNQYKVNIKINDNVLPFLKVKDKIKISYIKNGLNEIIKLERS